MNNNSKPNKYLCHCFNANILASVCFFTLFTLSLSLSLSVSLECVHLRIALALHRKRILYQPGVGQIFEHFRLKINYSMNKIKPKNE